MSGDKELRAHEAALESTDQDDWDMQRLGKVQQLKVRWMYCGEARGARELTGPP